MQKGTYFFVKTGVRLFALVPFKLLYLISDALAWIFLHLIKYRLGVIKTNLQNAFPKNPPAMTEQAARNYYRHFCDMLLESLKGLTLPKQELQRRFTYTNPEIFDALFEKGESAILLGSHHGNWEWGVLSFPLAVRQTVVGIYKPVKNRLIDSYLNDLRSRWGMKLTSMSQTGRAIARYRSQPSIFVFIADQTPIDLKNAHWLEFLHQDTPFLHGADKIAKQTGYPVFMFDMWKVKRGFYEVAFSELCKNPSELREGEITALFARKLEEIIRRKPEYWLWSHRRWKRKRTTAIRPG